MSTDADTTSTAATSPAGGIWAPAYRTLTVGLVLAVTFVAFEALAVATIVPLVCRHLGDLRLYGWVFSAFLLSSLIGIVVAGTLADRVPLGQPMLAGLALFALGLVIGGTAPALPGPLGGRAGRSAAARGGLRGDLRVLSRGVAAADGRRAFHRMGGARPHRAGNRRPGGRGGWLAVGIPRPDPAGDRGRGAGRACPAERPAPREPGNGRGAVPGRARRGRRRGHGACVAQLRPRARGRRRRRRGRGPTRCLAAPADAA